MPEALAGVWLVVGIFTCGALVAAAAMVLAVAWEFRRTLRRVNGMVPEAEAAIVEVRQTARRIRKLLKPGQRAAEHIESVVHRACDGAAQALDQIESFAHQGPTSLLGRWFRNGKGAGPGTRSRSPGRR